MRILLVGNYPLDKQASMSRYAEMLCRQLSMSGHKVEVIRPRPVVGDWVRQPFLRKWLGYLDKYIFFPVQLRSRAGGFDLVHVCDHSNSMYLAHTGDRAASITCHDLLAIESARGKFPMQKVSFTGRLLQRWILMHLADARDVVCVSDNTARDLAALSKNPAQRIEIIPNALNPDCGPATKDKILRMRSQIGIAADERYLFHIGAEVWYKNRLGVLNIFHMLLEKLGEESAPVPRLVIAGQPFTQTLRDFVSAKLPEGSVLEVVNPGDDDLWSLYSGATALLFPSLHEGFGWPLIEAQRCGCPVITSDRPPMNEVAGSAALYIDPEDEAAAAALIAANLDNLALLKEAGFRNTERFDPAVVFHAYSEFFAEVADRQA